MNVQRCQLDGLLIIEPKVFGDARGFFLETWNRRRYREAGMDADFVQDNVSFSRRGTLRGLHFQNPKPQGKLLQVLLGEVFDVAVDIRRSSPTFGKWHGLVLSAENKRQFYIPPGFAHGFAVLSETALVPLQVHRVLLAEGRNGHPLGRSRHRHRMAAEGAAAVGAGREGLASARRAARTAVRLSGTVMELPRILLIGKIGQVGWELRRTLAPDGPGRVRGLPGD